MEILIGFLLCFVPVITFTLGFVFGIRYNKTSQEKEAVVTAIEKEEKETLKRQKGFNNIMNYDIKVAIGETEQLEE